MIMARYAVLCPGQGNQHSAMFDRLLGNRAAGEVLQQAAEILGDDPVKFIRQEPEDRLFANTWAQPLIAAAELATWAALRDALPSPALFAGYSAGELPAYGCAQALSAAETLQLVRRRTALMDQAGGAAGGLLGMRGIGRSRAEELCREFGVEIAIVNGADHFVIGGANEALARLENLAPDLGIARTKRLPVSLASHTSMLAGAVGELTAVLAESNLRPPPVPVLAGISGEVVRQRERAILVLGRQVAQTVQWETCMRTAVEMGCRIFLEIGPGNALAQMLREAFPELKARAVEEFRTLQGVIDWMHKNLD